jgi:predicted esterase
MGDSWKRCWKSVCAIALLATGCGQIDGAVDGLHGKSGPARPQPETSSATPSSSGGVGASATTPASTTAPAAATPTSLPPLSARAIALWTIVDAYVASGDLPTALSALSAQQATPDEVLGVVRGPRNLPQPAGGTQDLQITDGYGTQTDLQVVAPPPAEVLKRASKGLGLVVLLHGLGGSSKDCLTMANVLAGTNEVVAVAPSAQLLPAGFQPEDGCPASIASAFPKWWIYSDEHTFALQGIRKACSLYPIDPERVVLCGASMGGFGAWNTGFRHADRWAGVVEACGGLTRMSFAGLDDPLSESLVQNGLMFPVWGAHGTADTIVPYAQDKACADKLTALGGDVTFHTIQGAGHDLAASIATDPTLMPEVAKFATTKVRKSHPTSLTYVAGNSTLDGAHWLRIATGAGSAGGTLSGQIDTATNTITLSGSGVSTARVYLDDKILDTTKPVTIQVGGATVWTGSITTDMTSVLESWASREDAGLVFPAYAEVTP